MMAANLGAINSEAVSTGCNQRWKLRLAGDVTRHRRKAMQDCRLHRIVEVFRSPETHIPLNAGQASL